MSQVEVLKSKSRSIYPGDCCSGIYGPLRRLENSNLQAKRVHPSSSFRHVDLGAVLDDIT